MKRALMLTLGLALTPSAAQAASLADQLPAGALLTLETRNAGAAVDRLGGLVLNVMDALGEDGDDLSEMLSGLSEIFNGSVGREGAVGVFSVGRAGGSFTPELLAVARVDELPGEFFGSLFKKVPGAKVGNYAFSRQGDVYAGLSGGLVYLSSDKDLLMAYLGRLSGKAAPRLSGNAAYAVPKKPVGAQEFSLFLNFSAAAKVARAALSELGLPRLLSPVVDALDTLGSYAAGFSTTAGGLNATAAHAANAQGKDRPLHRMLTHQTEFAVQDVIPADVEAVRARACHPESGAYLGRWLTRLDLFDPLGFLTDSQLASHLERSGTYLAGECAQVTLAGGMQAGLEVDNPLASLDHMVSYQRVRDPQAARAHLPEYAASVNAAIQGALENMDGLLGLGEQAASALPGDLGELPTAYRSQLLMGADSLKELLGDVKMVYAFQGDYLVTAFSEKALAAALADTAGPLSADSAFQAAALPVRGAGWSYQADLPDLDPEAFREAMAQSLSDMDDLRPSEEELADLDPEEREMLEELLAEQREELDGVAVLMAEVTTDLINRFDGLTSASALQGGVMVTKSSVKYRWE